MFQRCFLLCLLIPKMPCGLEGEIAVVFLCVWMEGLDLSWALVWPFRFLVSLCDRSFVPSAHWPSCHHFHTAEKPDDTWTTSWAELACPQLSLFLWILRVSIKFCLCPWIRLFTSASWRGSVMIFTAAPRGRQASSYLSATSSVSRWSVMSRGRQGTLSGTHLRPSFLCIYITPPLLQSGQFMLVKDSRWCLLSRAERRSLQEPQLLRLHFF